MLALGCMIRAGLRVIIGVLSVHWATGWPESPHITSLAGKPPHYQPARSAFSQQALVLQVCAPPGTKGAVQEQGRGTTAGRGAGDIPSSACGTGELSFGGLF